MEEEVLRRRETHGGNGLFNGADGPKRSESNMKVALSTVLAGLLAAAFFVTTGVSCKPREETIQEQAPAQPEMDEEERKREAFIESIEERYERVLALEAEGDIDGAFDEADLFIQYGRQDYQDIEQVHKRINIAKLKEHVRGLPAAYPAQNLEIYQQLMELDPSDESYRKKVDYYTAKLEEEQARIDKSELEVVRMACYKTKFGQFTKAEGEVKNVSDGELKRVAAVVTWYDGEDNPVVTESAVLPKAVLAPGESSEFKVIADYQPEMKRAGVKFEYVLGEEIDAYVREKRVAVAAQQPE